MFPTDNPCNAHKLHKSYRISREENFISTKSSREYHKYIQYQCSTVVKLNFYSKISNHVKRKGSRSPSSIYLANLILLPRFNFVRVPHWAPICNRAFLGPYGAARSAPRHTFGAIRDLTSQL